MVYHTWVHLARLPLELWSESTLRKVLSPVRRVVKADLNSEEVSKGIFARVCTEVD